MKKRARILASLIAVKELAILFSSVIPFWALIEFILYLVKDKEFNWWSVWVFIISVVVAIILITVTVYFGHKFQIEYDKEIESHKQVRPKSRFQQRLDEAMNNHN